MRWKWLPVLIVMALFILATGASTAYFSTSSFSGNAYQLPGGIVDKSSPTLADVDEDGIPEVLVGTTACGGSPCAYNQPTVLVVMKGEGTILWSKNVGAPINSAPAVGDINRDGHPEIVVSFGGDVVDTRHNGGVIAFDRFGNQLWKFTTQDRNGDGYADGVYSSPMLCDVDGNGNMQIAFGGWDQRIYLLDHNGKSLWNNLPTGYPGPGYYNADSVWSTAACADLNRDGRKEIIIGADITGGGILPDGTHTQDGGFLYIFDKDGNVLVRRFLPEAIYATPAVGDLNGDAKLEIVSGTSWFWWNAHGRTEQPYVYAFDTSHVFNTSLQYADPAKLPYLSGWPQPTDYPGFSSPALADLDGDGKLEIVIGTSHPDLRNDGILGAGSVYAWRPNGQLYPGWPIHPKNQYGDDGPIFSSPTVADVDGDGHLEVLFSMLWDVQVYSTNGSLKARLGTTWSVWGSPAVGDTNGDGYPDIWIGGGNYYNSSHGYLWNFKSSTSGIKSLPWPMFARDAQHSSRHPSNPILSVSPSSVYVMHQLNDPNPETYVLSVRNLGDGTLNWSASAPSGVSLSPSSGTVSSQGQTTVTISTAGRSLGVNNLGNITFTGTSGNSSVTGSPASIPVTLNIVQQLYKLMLPLILR